MTTHNRADTALPMHNPNGQPCCNDMHSGRLGSCNISGVWHATPKVHAVQPAAQLLCCYSVRVLHRAPACSGHLPPSMMPRARYRHWWD